MTVALKTFKTNNFSKGKGKLVQLLWILCNAFFLKNSLFVFMKFKVILLRIFGAKIGHGTIIKPNVNIKFPWKLVIGNDVWIGEGVWIDNLDKVTIGDDVCISQGALLLTGNHDYKSSSFDYKNEPINIENGVWIGAKSVVCPGVICKNECILTVGSVATKDLESFGIYQGNPALLIRQRKY
ncbi:WcaF family extracellular polysaccharide biosynthesis acetyltransferase [Flavobacterium galactosidilyticum]|uniref:WcaF family extracellular polysaccharide biosynthesis acetyltransferase n=1 Tax=Flavobacterium galactosidilyticum TaxID=2893886 RepID=UPI001E34F4E8|nr:WcaF family extracellular polysaccharide biosynthesis acetyltransferase [Flavobacterium sp. F-340]UFH45655.1 WcaF family extracellular polysaccharide biosynthesis acetyltransferase [Flavobacterium sp. F-340]